MEDVAAENLADTTETDLESDGADPTDVGVEKGEEDEDLSRFDDEDDVRGYRAVISEGVASMAILPEDENVVMEDVWTMDH